MTFHEMSIEVFGPFPIGYFFLIELLELSVCFGDEFFVGIFVLKYFFLWFFQWSCMDVKVGL